MVLLKSLLCLISGICEFYLNRCDLDIWPNLLFTLQFEQKPVIFIHITFLAEYLFAHGSLLRQGAQARIKQMPNYDTERDICRYTFSLFAFYAGEQTLPEALQHADIQWLDNIMQLTYLYRTLVKILPSYHHLKV